MRNLHFMQCIALVESFLVVESEYLILTSWNKAKRHLTILMAFAFLFDFYRYIFLVFSSIVVELLYTIGYNVRNVR